MSSRSTMQPFRFLRTPEALREQTVNLPDLTIHVLKPGETLQ